MPEISRSRQVSNLGSEIVFVKDFGAVGDGIVDDTSAIQAALTACINTGAEVWLTGEHKITGTLTVEGCTLKGTGVFIRSDYTTAGFLTITDTSDEAILLKGSGAVDGINFYYPDQVTTLTPTVYPPTILFNQVDGSNQTLNARIINNTFVNSYIAIDTGGLLSNSSSTGSTRIANNNICAISIGIKHTYALNEIHIIGNQATYALWSESVGADIRKTINNSAEFIQLHDVDGANIMDNLVFGYGVAVAFHETSILTTINGNLFDGCYRCIDFSGATAIGEVTITGNTFLGKDSRATSAPTDCACLYGVWTTGTISGFIISSGNTYANTDGEHIWLSSTSSASTTLRLKSNDSFYSAGRNDSSGTHYSIYFTDTSGKSTADIIGMFEDNVNSGSNVSTAIYLDGLAFASLDVFVNGYQTGLNITSTNANGRHHIRRYQGKTTTTDITDGSGVGQTVYGTIFPDESKTAMNAVSSQATITLPQTSVEYITVTGTTTITSVTASWWGRKVTLKFNGGLTFTDGSNLKLAGNFSTSADDTITLICDGTNWLETSRSVN